MCCWEACWSESFKEVFMQNEVFERIPWLKEYMDGADHIDINSGQGKTSLRAFVAALLSYQPNWMRFLWSVRSRLLRLLGQGESVIPERERYSEATIPVVPGEHAAFFEVKSSDGEAHWVAVGEESHLGAAIAVVVEPLDDSGLKRFQVMTVVRYRNWAGPLYFALIRPFHYLVVACSMRQALRTGR